MLISATAATSIAAGFGVSRREDLMAYGAGAFFLFGLGSLPPGRRGWACCWPRCTGWRRRPGWRSAG